MTSLPGMISLGGGMPNPALFPFRGLSVTFDDGTTVALPKVDVEGALQYGATEGHPELLRRVGALQTAEHAPPRPVASAITPGSQDGLAKLFDMLVEEGDTLLVEAPTYSGSLAYLEAMGCRLATAATDGGGLIPEALAAQLDGWVPARDGAKPRVMYVIATGSNPTGASLSAARKAAIYAIAARHGMLIIEDDPYYYLQYAATRTPSFLSMDVDGRVVRCDSFSKILSAGLRVGVVTGPPAILERLILHNQATLLHPSGVSQVLALALLRHWRVGEPGATGAAARGGLDRHLEAVRAFYSAQCDAFMASADRHLRANADGTGALLAAYSRPSAGMFVWMALHGVEDSFDLIARRAVDKKVLMVPGAAFFPGKPRTNYVRAAFSTASPAAIDTALQRLGDLLREEGAARAAKK